VDEVMLDARWALNEARSRLYDYALFRQYYRGRHRLLFATEKFRNTFGPLFRSFYDNLSRSVVDSYVDRLEVTGFDINEQAKDDAAWELWDDAKMDLRSKEVHREALRCGDSYVIVWPDEDAGTGDTPSAKVCLYPQTAYSCCVEYDQEDLDTITKAAKWWKTATGQVRLNLYYPDRIVKLITPGKIQGDLPSLGAKFVEAEPDTPNPWGVVPVFHFAHDADSGQYGQSLLENLIPLQDALNKSVIDLLVAMEYASFPQRWITGIEFDVDPATNQPIQPFAPGIDRVWTTTNGEASFGQFDAANLQQYLAVADSFRMELARIGGPPLHYLLLQSGNWPSGEAMKTAEAKFVGSLEDMQATFGSVWEDVMLLAMRMSGRSDVQECEPVWKPAEPHSDQTFFQNLLYKQQLGVPQSTLWEEMGYTQEQIAGMQQQKDQALQQQQQMMVAGAKGFDNGTLPAVQRMAGLRALPPAGSAGKAAVS
jgi:hypothetical protein